ncbi:hypothetical protein EVAR_48356_1 [Eumeta japonica]|uniref:Uncharacterized protein n=1 Tax=Eumeta variegata TaxID=151549 RepID=A0A4C1WJR7_EUMVA|nr:hypothetical protein EVAR_48356_1 [Eumeta japonica]
MPESWETSLQTTSPGGPPSRRQRTTSFRCRTRKMGIRRPAWKNDSNRAPREAQLAQYLFGLRLRDSSYCARDSGKMKDVEECDMFLRQRI